MITVVYYPYDFTPAQLNQLKDLLLPQFSAAGAGQVPIFVPNNCGVQTGS